MERETQGQDENHRKPEARDVALALASVREIQRFVAALPDRDRRSPEEITAQLNEVYTTEPGELDPVFRRAQARAIGADYA